MVEERTRIEQIPFFLTPRGGQAVNCPACRPAGRATDPNITDNPKSPAILQGFGGASISLPLSGGTAASAGFSSVVVVVSVRV